jgi:phosphopentomutase
MDDVHKSRPQDIGANTFRHIIDTTPNLKLENLEKLGLMNVIGSETHCMKTSSNALYGMSKLSHFGADTFYGHQEIMGSTPVMPVIEPFRNSIDKVYSALIQNGYRVEYVGDKLKFLLVNGCVTVADNIEADPGQIYNVTSSLDLIDYREVVKIGRIVRSMVSVPRVIAFGGQGVSLNDILNAVELKEDKYIGINAPKSGVYNKGYKVIHLGSGVNPDTQVPTILGSAGIDVVLLGKVADIVENPYGKNIPWVDTEEVLEMTMKEIKSMKRGFIAVNVQETDLAGHSQDAVKYAEKLVVVDKYVGQIMDEIYGDDILIIMADHGNDPTIGHSHHTRENVPILIYSEKMTRGYIGCRNTLSDVGATVCKYFKCRAPQNGSPFLNKIII